MVTIVGTTCRRKGQRYFIKAALDLLARNKYPVRFFIVGARSSPYLDQLERMAGGNGRIHFIPETDRVYDYYFLSDIFVCASLAESFPRIILEAMAFSLPIVTTQAGGISEAVRDGQEAVFARRASWRSLAGAIIHLLESPGDAARIGEAGRARVEELFTADIMSQRYAELIRDLCGGV